MNLQTTIAQVQQALEDVFGRLDQYFELPADERTYKLDAQSWSVDEILEHVTLTSHFLLIVIRRGKERALKRAQRHPIEAGDIDLSAIDVISHPDAFAWLRPEHMEPTQGRSSAEVREIMRDQRQECLEILRQLGNGEGTLHKVRMSVQQLGKLDMYQWLYFLSQHAKRHAAEIERIRERWERR
jgi:hypothetical protein